MSDASLTIAALFDIAKAAENPSRIRLRAWQVVGKFVEPISQLPDAVTARWLCLMLRELTRQLDAVTPRHMPARELPTPDRWLN